MDFIFSFPSLKQLSILKFCQHLVDHKIGPFEKFRNDKATTSSIADRNTFRERYLHVVQNLAIPGQFKGEIWDVLSGLYDQTSFSSILYQDFPKDDLQLYFDANGQIHEKRIWKQYFEKHADVTERSTLLNLLKCACTLYLLPEIDVCLKKIWIMAGLQEVTLRGPRHEDFRGKHMLMYGLNERVSLFIRDVFPQDLKWSSAQVTVHRATIAVTLNPSDLNFQSFQTYFNILEPPQQEEYIKDVILSQKYWYTSTGLLLEILTFLNRSKLNWVTYFAERDMYGYTHAFNLLGRLLDWPFTLFFIPTLMLLSSVLKEKEYTEVFHDIARRIFKLEHYGALHGNLLLEYWSVIPVGVKQKFKSLYQQSDHQFLMEIALLEKKSFPVYDAIMADLIQ